MLHSKSYLTLVAKFLIEQNFDNPGLNCVIYGMYLCIYQTGMHSIWYTQSGAAKRGTLQSLKGYRYLACLHF